MGKEKDLKRKAQLNAKAKVESLMFQVNWGRKQRMPELAEDDSRIVSEVKTIIQQDLVEDMLTLHNIVDGVRNETGIEPEDEKGSLRGAIVPYLLGISKYNPLEKEWYDGNLLDSEQIRLPLQVDIFYDNEVRNRVVDWVKARYQGMTTRLGQPALKLQHCTVVFRRVVKS